jgi:hypothetical protein
LQRDPLGVAEGPNLYEYVRSAVVTNTDPLGLGDEEGKGKGKGKEPEPDGWGLPNPGSVVGWARRWSGAIRKLYDYINDNIPAPPNRPGGRRPPCEPPPAPPSMPDPEPDWPPELVTPLPHPDLAEPKKEKGTGKEKEKEKETGKEKETERENEKEKEKGK